MDNLKRRKFNTYYWTCTVIASCMLILSNIDWQTILSLLLGVTIIPFVTLDERGQYGFEDGENNG